MRMLSAFRAVASLTRASKLVMTTSGLGICTYHQRTCKVTATEQHRAWIDVTCTAEERSERKIWVLQTEPQAANAYFCLGATGTCGSFRACIGGKDMTEST